MATKTKPETPPPVAAQSPPDQAKGWYRLLPPSRLIPTKLNTREIRDADLRASGLVDSVKDGVYVPGLARPIPDDADNYDLIDGARRRRACELAGVEAMPVIVRDIDDDEALKVVVIANLQREDLRPLEEAMAIQILLDKGWTHKQAADRVGRSEKWVARRAQLTHLIPAIQKRLTDADDRMSTWPAEYLEFIARYPADVQKQISSELEDWRLDDISSIADLKKQIAEFQHSLAAAPFQQDDATLVPKAGPCTTCPKRSDRQPVLFDDDEVTAKKGGTCSLCLDAACWEKKVEALTIRKADELRKEHGTVLFCIDSGSTRKGDYWHGKVNIQSWDIRRAKKGTPGAVPVLHVTGAKAGTVEWHLSQDAAAANKAGGTASGSKKGASGGTSTTSKPAERPLKERLAQHEVYRVRIVLADLADMLDAWYASGVKDGNLPKMQSFRVVALAAAFGTRDRADSLYSNGVHAWADYKALCDKDDAIENLLAKTCGVLATRMRGAIQNDKQGQTEARALCDALALDYAALYAKAALEKPYPKSWGVDADGKPVAKRETKPVAKETKPAAAETPATRKRARKVTA